MNPDPPREIRLPLSQAPPPGAALRLEQDDYVLALFHVADRWFAIDDACAHRGGPLSEGWIEADAVVCPLHGWRYDVRTGACATMRGHDVRSFPVRVEDDTLVIVLG